MNPCDSCDDVVDAFPPGKSQALFSPFGKATGKVLMLLTCKGT